MSLKTIKGNLITLAENGHFDVIIHGCNCFHTMGSGIARQIADKYPEVAFSDKNTKYGVKTKLGSWSQQVVLSKEGYVFTVINAYTQFSISKCYEDVFEYDAFQKFLNNYKEQIKCHYRGFKEKTKTRIGFPMIGAGYARGNWEKIYDMINAFANDPELMSLCDVTIVEYR